MARDSKVTFLVSEDGYIAFSVLPKESPTGGKLIRLTGSADTLMVLSTNLARHTTPGRYRITGRDGAFWLTDIKWEEEQQ